MLPFPCFHNKFISNRTVRTYISNQFFSYPSFQNKCPGPGPFKSRLGELRSLTVTVTAAGPPPVRGQPGQAASGSPQRCVSGGRGPARPRASMARARPSSWQATGTGVQPCLTGCPHARRAVVPQAGTMAGSIGGAEPLYLTVWTVTVQYFQVFLIFQLVFQELFLETMKSWLLLTCLQSCSAENFGKRLAALSRFLPRRR